MLNVAASREPALSAIASAIAAKPRGQYCCPPRERRSQVGDLFGDGALGARRIDTLEAVGPHDDLDATPSQG
jgi:hypothetical protein